MRVEPEILSSPTEVGAAAAEHVARRIAQSADAARPFLLGCPSGRSPEPVYTELARLVRDQRLDLAHVVVVMMDDYVIADRAGLPVRVTAGLPFSCEGFARDRIAGPLSEAAREAGRRGVGDVWLPEPSDPSAYDDRIAQQGGIDVFLLASGASDGHVAFNPPGSARASVTRLIDLPESTRRDNMVTFPTFRSLDDVPARGVSVGLATIADLSKEALMVVHGADKGLAFARLREADSYDATWPATILADCRAPRLLADEAAARAADRLAAAR